MVIYDLDKERAKKLPKDILIMVSKVSDLKEEALALSLIAKAKYQELIETQEELLELVKQAEEHDLSAQMEQIIEEVNKL